MATPDPGWYPDPPDHAISRWWDGAQWTAGTRQLAKPRREVGDNFRRLALVVLLLLVVTAVVDVAMIYGDVFLLDVADQFTRREPDPEDASTADRISLVSGFGYLAMLLITGIVFIIWLYQAHSSNRMRPDALRHKSGWAIGGWFVPILNFWRPFGVTIDLRRGALALDARATPLMWVWWLTYLTGLLMDRISAGLWADDEAAGLREFGRALRTAAQADIVSNVVDILAAVLAVLVVRSLTRVVLEAPVVS